MLFIFVPILSLILLALNLFLAPHVPYEAKVSAYECGYNALPGQTRSTFQIGFYLVAILFLVFDLEILLILPIVDLGRIRGAKFRPFLKFAYWLFVFNFINLMDLGSKHAESPYIEVGQASTALYFLWFLLIVPAIGLLENTLADFAKIKK